MYVTNLFLVIWFLGVTADMNKQDTLFLALQVSVLKESPKSQQRWAMVPFLPAQTVTRESLEGWRSPCLIPGP